MCSGEPGDGEDATTNVDGSATESALLSCPGCGRPITGLTSTGPHTGVVRPCGCSVAPGLIHREADRRSDRELDRKTDRETDHETARRTDRGDDE